MERPTSPTKVISVVWGVSKSALSSCNVRFCIFIIRVQFVEQRLIPHPCQIYTPPCCSNPRVHCDTFSMQDIRRRANNSFIWRRLLENLYQRSSTSNPCSPKSSQRVHKPFHVHIWTVYQIQRIRFATKALR